MSKLKENAKKAIKLAINDYSADETDREYSAIRNIYAGLLLILKDKLIRLSPPDTNEVLIKKIIVPVINNGKLKFIGKGKSTVDVQQIKERFNSLDIHLDWKLFTTIQKERNNIEHYYTSTGKDAIRRLIVLSFVLIRDFIKHELDESPIDYISKESWERLLEIEDIYERERKECIHEIDEMINDQHIKNVVMNFVCQKCGSNLVSPIEGLTPLTLMCKSCSDEFEYEKSMVEIISRQYSMRNYVSYKETGTYETYECPNCRNDSFSEEEQICLICGYQKRYEKCWRCGETLTVDEQILEGLCSACNNEYNSLMEDD